MKKITIITILALSLPAVGFSFNYSNITKAIYGKDDRHEPRQSLNPKIIEYAKATAAMVDEQLLRYIPDLNSYIFPTTTLEDDMQLCSGERFSQQTHIASCSGFLVAPDILVTAGHCITSQADCDNFTWVFDYNDKTTMINKKNLFHCAKIIKQQQKSNFFTLRDYAIIRLDRPTTGRKPLKFRTEGWVKPYTKLVMIGHPTGLPLKYDANGSVARHWNYEETKNLRSRISTLFKRSAYFTANIDAFAGNSGSPVINLSTGKVEGILISGGNDYEVDFNQGCYVASYFKDVDREVQEMFFRITKIKELKELVE